MIGDRIDNDIVPAKQLGMKTIWVKQGLGSLWNITDESEKADAIIKSIYFRTPRFSNLSEVPNDWFAITPIL